MNDAHAEAIGQLVWVGSPLHLRVSQALNSVCQGWQKVPLPTEPSHFSWYWLPFVLLKLVVSYSFTLICYCCGTENLIFAGTSEIESFCITSTKLFPNDGWWYQTHSFWLLHPAWPHAWIYSFENEGLPLFLWLFTHLPHFTASSSLCAWVCGHVGAHAHAHCMVLSRSCIQCFPHNGWCLKVNGSGRSVSCSNISCLQWKYLLLSRSSQSGFAICSHTFVKVRTDKPISE